MEWLTLEDLFETHHQAIFRSGGSDGIRDRGGLESALAQAMQSFGGIDLYPTFLDKVAALGFFLIRNHPFIDGNKRIGHAALEIVLQMNGYEILADETEQEAVILALVGSELSIESFNQWVKSVVVLLNSSFMEVENL